MKCPLSQPVSGSTYQLSGTMTARLVHASRGPAERKNRLLSWFRCKAHLCILGRLRLSQASAQQVKTQLASTFEFAGSCFKCLPSFSDLFFTSSPRTAALSDLICCREASFIRSQVLSMRWSHSLTDVQRRADLHACAASVLNWLEKCFIVETYPGPFPALTSIVSMKEAVCRSCKGFFKTRDISQNTTDA